MTDDTTDTTSMDEQPFKSTAEKVRLAQPIESNHERDYESENRHQRHREQSGGNYHE